jgi:transposase
VEQKLVEWLEEDPHQAHERFLATSWTVPMLVIALATYLNIAVCCNTVRNGLRRLRLHWGRPRLAMPQKTNPEKTRKQWAMVKAVVDAGPDAAILYGDESRVQTLALIRAMWHWIGQQLRVPTPGSNTARALFGALNIRTGEWIHMVRQRMRKEDFIAFLEHLLVVYPSQTILLIVDNYSSHTAFELTSWLEHHPRLQLHFLPKYCSHLNPVESIWLRMKNYLAGNRLYGSIRILLDTLDSFLDTMTPEIALRWAGIKSNRNLLRPT